MTNQAKQDTNAIPGGEGGGSPAGREPDGFTQFERMAVQAVARAVRAMAAALDLGDPPDPETAGDFDGPAAADGPGEPMNQASPEGPVDCFECKVAPEIVEAPSLPWVRIFGVSCPKCHRSRHGSSREAAIDRWNEDARAALIRQAAHPAEPEPLPLDCPECEIAPEISKDSGPARNDVFTIRCSKCQRACYGLALESAVDYWNRQVAIPQRDNEQTEFERNFVESFTAFAGAVHSNARAKGFWEGDRNDGECLALIHSEISEALEALRKGGSRDEHCPGYMNVEIELADAVIRIMDLAVARGWAVGQAIVAKHRFNTTRPHKHGKGF